MCETYDPNQTEYRECVACDTPFECGVHDDQSMCEQCDWGIDAKDRCVPVSQDESCA